MKTHISRRLRGAFSLIELTVVMSIIAIAVALAVPAASTVIRGSYLTQGSQLAADQFALGRQMALTNNRPVEMRFYKFADLEAPGEVAGDKATWKYRAVQLFDVLNNGRAIPIGKIEKLPVGVIFSLGEFEGNPLSTLLTDPSIPIDVQPDTSIDPEIPGRVAGKNSSIGHNYVYRSFRFLQDGGTNLPVVSSESGTGNSSALLWFVTLLDQNARLTDSIMPNFFTVQVDATTGTTKTFRPQAK